LIQSFERAMLPIEFAKSEGQIALDLAAVLDGADVLMGAHARVTIVDEGPGQVPGAMEIAIPRATLFNDANIRVQMAEAHGKLGVFTTEVQAPSITAQHEPGMEMVEL